MGLSEIQKIEHMAEDLRDQVSAILDQARFMLSCRPELAFEYRVVVWETWRDEKKQWRTWAKGRELVDGRWVVVDRRRVRTWARPQECAHCVVDAQGRPASEAVDLAIVSKVRWLPDGHPGWSVIPAAAYIVGGDTWEMGAAFKRIPGGDWPHIQRRNWLGKIRSAKIA